MPRSDQLAYPQREPAAPRPASTLLLLRDGPQGPEILMTRRSMKASFAPGAFVFPGGAIEPGDALARDHATRRASQDNAQVTIAIAAIRETFEELGVLLARHGGEQPVSPAEVTSMDRNASLLAQCEQRGLLLAAGEVYTLARWITDRDLPKRFDVPFLVARMPPGQTPVADNAEQFQPVWIRPADALARHAQGDFLIIYPTIRTLERLGSYATVDAVLQACAGEAPLWTSCPRGGLVRGKIERYMEREPPFGELALTCPDGQVLHALDWQPERPVALLKNVQRLTAPNAGFMTGPGTNSYIIGTTASGYVVIDPGPNDPAHIQRLHDATDGDIRCIICTHSHPDHAPGAKPLQALCAGKPPILGLPSAPTAREHSRFTPDRALADGERITLTEKTSGTTHTLRAIHTPGHAANHLCLVLEEDGLLFSGDHILNGSTTVIDPPDGNMTAYLDSLARLDAACAAGQLEFILPAHGYVLWQPRAVIAFYRAHRLEREAKVRAAMEANPAGTLDDWLPVVYDDVPQAAWPVARRSLAAHVERLRELAEAPAAPAR